MLDILCDLSSIQTQRPYARIVSNSACSSDERASRPLGRCFSPLGRFLWFLIAIFRRRHGEWHEKPGSGLFALLES
jgi:hypothetical protein